MRLRAFWLCAGLREERLSSLAIVDLHQVADLPKHACEDRPVVVLDGPPDLAEPERTQGPPVLLALADLTTNLGDPDFRHLSPLSGSEPLSPFSRLYRGGRLNMGLWLRATNSALVLVRGLVRQDLVDRQPAHLRDLVGAAEALEAVDRRLGHVDRVRRAEALRQDVADAGQLEHGADAAARNHAGPFARGTQEHARCIGASEDLVRDRRAVLRHGEEVLLRIVDRLRDGERNLPRLPVADADPIDLVADHDERGKGEAPAALDDLCDTVDLNHALLELATLLALDHGTLDAGEFGPCAQAVTFRSDRVLWPRKASQARTQEARVAGGYGRD